MTVEEVLSLAHRQHRKLILHNGQVFFNTRDAEDARAWQDMGAKLRHFIGPSRDPATEGWEVHLASMVDPVWEDNEGVERNAAPRLLYAAAQTEAFVTAAVA